MDQQTAEAIVAEDMDNLGLREDYSGRGMFGETTTAVVGDKDDFQAAKDEALQQAIEDEDEELVEGLKGGFKEDDMGLRMVFY